MTLSPDGWEITLFSPEVFPCDGIFTRPETLASELVAAAGPYLDEPGHVGHCFLGWVQEDTYYGDRVPDVIFALNPQFGGNHGELPTARWGESSLRSLFVMAGPGIKKGVRGKPFWLVDIAPTAAYLIGAPRPRDAEGAVLFAGLKRDTW